MKPLPSKILAIIIAISCTFVPCLIIFDKPNTVIGSIATILAFRLYRKIYMYFKTLKAEKDATTHDIEEVIKSGDFVVYLRSFHLDTKTREHEETNSTQFSIIYTKIYTTLEQITNSFKQNGLEVFSLSDPTKESFNLGTHQIKIAKGKEWREVISPMLENAKLIIMNCAFPAGQNKIKEGFTWELRECLETELLRRKTLLLIPGTNKSLQEFKGLLTNARLLNYLPETITPNDKPYGGAISFNGNSSTFLEFEGTHLFNRSRLYIWAGIHTVSKDFQIIRSSYEIAPFFRGILANLLDVICVFTVLWICDFWDPSGYNSFGIVVAIFLGYLFCFSLGKRVFKISVRDKSGVPGQGDQLIARQILKLFFVPSFPILLVLKLAYPDKYKDVWWIHDLLTKTNKFQKIKNRNAS